MVKLCLEFQEGRHDVHDGIKNWKIYSLSVMNLKHDPRNDPSQQAFKHQQT